MIHFVEKTWGIHYAMGGTGALVAGLVKRFEERLEPKPIQKCLFLVVIFVIPVAIIALVPTLIDALVSSKNLFLFVGYSALRRVTQWLSDLFTFFYYVNQGRIADLEGAKKFATAGGFVVSAQTGAISFLNNGYALANRVPAGASTPCTRS
jgi:hypothetical protein